VDVSRSSWVNTTHEWAGSVDRAHLSYIRQRSGAFAPGGPWHLVLEVLAYAADEAGSRGEGHCIVVSHPDGSVSVRDDGRGTDTRVDEHGRAVKKPVMATKDLRFFDSPRPPLLPDGWPRRGMSVVAALSEWLVHVNRRIDGAWTQRYEYGVPVSGLEPVEADGTTGTLVHFKPDESLGAMSLPGDGVRADLAGVWPCLEVQVEARAG